MLSGLMTRYDSSNIEVCSTFRIDFFFQLTPFYQSENVNCFSSGVFLTFYRTSILPALKTIKM